MYALHAWNPSIINDVLHFPGSLTMCTNQQLDYKPELPKSVKSQQGIAKVTWAHRKWKWFFCFNSQC